MYTHLLFIFYMKKTLLCILAFICAGNFALAQMANPQEPLKNDPTIKVGKLDNGLTYYIKHNAKPEKRAEFYLFTNVGAIQENEQQAGLAHFLEHMALNGSKNMPGKMMISYLESIGCSFGRNINAGTGVEQTSYMLNNVPVIREGILDTCLLIMHDYAAFVTNDPKEIDNERGVIIEELRTRRTGDWRMFEQSLPYLYKGSKYATCNLIGTIEGLQSFPPSALQDFYKTWYRPDHQAVIVVGDVDVDQVESKLIALFADVPAPTTPSPKKVIPIPENDEPIIGILTDPEARNTMVEFLYKSEPVPNEMRPLGMIYMVNMFKSLISSMLNDRFEAIAQQPNAPFISAYEYFSPITTSCDAAYFSMACKDGEGLTAFEAFLTEIEKMKRFGFTDSELERAKTNYLRNLEQQAENAADRKNPEFIQMMISNYAYNDPMLDPAYELEVAKGYMPFIQLEQVNKVAQEVITEENRVLLFGSPAREGLAVPTEADFLAIFDKVANASLEAYQEESSDEPLVDETALMPGKIVKENASCFESTEWVLSNGVKVVIKPTDFKKDEVLFSAYCQGGISMLSEDLVPSVEGNVFSLWSQSSGVGNFNATQLKRKLTGKIANVSPEISQYRHGFQGGGSPKDLETLFQLLYAYVVTPRFVETEFEAPMAQINAVVPNLEKTPNFVLQKNLLQTMYNNNPYRPMISSEMIQHVSLEKLQKAYRQCLGHVDGMVVTLVGNVDLNALRPLVEKYVASLPVSGKASQWVNDGASIQKGQITNQFTTVMETPKTSIVNIYSASLDNNLKNSVTLSAIRSILNMTYTQTLREDEGGTYGASVDASLISQPTVQGLILVLFDTDPNPERVAKMSQIVKDDIQNIAKNGPSEEFVNKTKENMLKTRQENVISNGFWKNAIVDIYMENFDSVTDYESIVKELSPKTIQKFVKDFLKQGNFIDIAMNPQQ